MGAVPGVHFNALGLTTLHSCNSAITDRTKERGPQEGYCVNNIFTGYMLSHKSKASSSFMLGFSRTKPSRTQRSVNMHHSDDLLLLPPLPDDLHANGYIGHLLWIIYWAFAFERLMLD